MREMVIWKWQGVDSMQNVYVCPVERRRGSNLGKIWSTYLIVPDKGQNPQVYILWSQIFKIMFGFFTLAFSCVNSMYSVAAETLAQTHTIVTNFAKLESLQTSKCSSRTFYILIRNICLFHYQILPFFMSCSNLEAMSYWS